MPILCDPNSTFSVSLKSDEGKTPLPSFTVRCQSMRGQMRICEVIDKLAIGETTTADLFAETLEVLESVIVGWKNMPFAYEVGRVADLLNYSEARELLRSVLYASQLGPDEKKD